MLDFGFATPDEICAALAQRLKAARLHQGLQQAELAARAGVSRATVIALEGTGQVTLQRWIRVVQALGLQDELHELFVERPRSIAAMERMNEPLRKRAPRRRHGAGGGSA